MPSDTYVVSPVVIRLAESIYDAVAECHGLTVQPFSTIGARAREPFISSAARLLVAFNPHPRGRVRVAKKVKSQPKPTRFEVWNGHDRPVVVTGTIVDALARVQYPVIRVRTFYDRIHKRRIVQVFGGDCSLAEPDIESTARALTRAALTERKNCPDDKH